MLIGIYTPDTSGMTSREKAWNELWYQIGREDLEYDDNHRVARKDDDAEMEAYNEAVEQGCCGSFDIEVVIDGEKWCVGCNYGH